MAPLVHDQGAVCLTRGDAMYVEILEGVPAGSIYKYHEKGTIIKITYMQPSDYNRHASIFTGTGRNPEMFLLPDGYFRIASLKLK